MMPLVRSAARRVSRKDEVSPLLGWNGEPEDTASGDDLVVEMIDLHCSAGSWIQGGQH